MADAITFAHGFTQTARSWDPIRTMLHDRGIANTTAVDLPGHGAASEVRADLWGAADHLVAAGGHGTYVGYSMGGRVCLHAALAHPDSITTLVLIGATAGIDDSIGRDTRRSADEVLADRIESIGVEAFVDQWLTNPLFAGLTPAKSQRDDRLRNDAAGLASSLRLAGTGTQEPLWDRLAEINSPVLLLVGEHDDKFRAIADRLADALPHARVQVIANAGHSVHLEQPDATADAIAAFITP